MPRLSLRAAFSAVALAAALAAAPVLSAPARAADHLTVLLDWFVNPNHAPLVIGKAKGLFAAEGLDITLVAPADPNDPPKLVAAGKAELAISYQPSLQIQVAEGLPLARVATLVSTPLNTLMVLEAGPVQAIGDLKGRKIGYSVGGFEDALLTAMLARHGLTLKDVTLVNVNFSLSPALFAGNVDAVIGAFRNFESNQMAIEGKPGRAFFVEEEGVPAYDELIFVAHRDRVGDPRLPRFVAALEQAILYTINHPKDAWAAFAAAHKDLDDELNRRAFADTLSRFDTRPAALDRGRYERFAAFLKAQGLVKALPAVEAYAKVVR